MWRFWIYRTNEPSGTDSAEVDWCQESVDPLTGFDLTEVSSGIKSTWRYHKHWLETGKPPSPKIDNKNQSNEYLKKEALQLFEQMLEKAMKKGTHPNWCSLRTCSNQGSGTCQGTTAASAFE